MNELSIRTKMMAFIGATLALLVIALVSSTWVSMSNTNKLQSEKVQESILEEINEKLSFAASFNSGKISAYINDQFVFPVTMAGSVAETAQKGPLNRDDLTNIVMGALVANKNVSAGYVQFEPNGYDGLDSDFTDGSKNHSVPNTGVLEIYMTRDGTEQYTHHQVETDQEKLNQDKNKYGFRAGEWYLCARDKVAPCIVEPYLYEITPGNSQLMTSITHPVIVNGEFIGIAGADINLPIFQELAESISSSLYKGKAKVTILSDIGLLVGSSEHPDSLGKLLSEVESKSEANSIMKIRKNLESLEIGDNLVYSSPVEIKAAKTKWSLIIEIPKSIAMENALEIANSQMSATSSLGFRMIAIGAFASIAAMTALFLITNSITNPIKEISKRVQNLSSSDGDLTVELHVDKHEELITLAGGFNQFTNKLRGMINELKELATESQHESENTSNLANSIKSSVDRQNNEVNSVVTAITELSATSSEVAASSETAASNTTAANEKISSSERNIKSAADAVQNMSKQVTEARKSIGEVATKSEDITQILDVIRNIADQTNLLALNAAIEAARAGEQGRGFAVVADEVRALASKTQDSTNEISTLIENLQSEVRSSEDIIEMTSEQADKALENCEKSAIEIHEMVQELDNITNEVTQIATAAEEQSVVTEDLNKNMHSISMAANELSNLADNVEETAQNLAKIVRSKNSQLGQLKS